MRSGSPCGTVRPGPKRLGSVSSGELGNPQAGLARLHLPSASSQVTMCPVHLTPACKGHGNSIDVAPVLGHWTVTRDMGQLQVQLATRDSLASSCSHSYHIACHDPLAS